MKCVTCDSAAKIKVAKTGEFKCVECFLSWFEQDVHEAITSTAIFSLGERVALGVSGGKDSTVLAFVLNKLNVERNYGLDFVLICIDEGIRGYRDDSIREARKTEADLGLPMNILSYQEIYGWTMDDIVARIGKKNNCTFCGVFRRQALDRGALKAGAVKLVTGHNADDLAETVLMNVLRGDVARLQRMAAHITPGDASASDGGDGALPRVKPLRYSYEKDIVMYAHFRKLNYFSTECIYAPNSYRGNARTLIKDLERERPAVILALVRSGESLKVKSGAIGGGGGVKLPTLRHCDKCGYISSQQFCKACVLLYSLNNGDTTVGTSSKKGKVSVKIMMEDDLTPRAVANNSTNNSLRADAEPSEYPGDSYRNADYVPTGDSGVGCGSEDGGGCVCQNRSVI